MSRTQTQLRKVSVVPVLATLLVCGGTQAYAGDLLASVETTRVAVGCRKYDELSCIMPAIDSSRDAGMVQTDAQIDEAFVLPAVQVTESNLVAGQRAIAFLPREDDGISHWLMNCSPGSTVGNNLFVCGQRERFGGYWACRVRTDENVNRELGIETTKGSTF